MNKHTHYFQFSLKRIFGLHVHRERMIIISGDTVSQYDIVSGAEPNDWLMETEI